MQFTDIGVVSSIEVNHKQVDMAHKGEEVCIKVEATGGDAPRLYGRHFDHTDLLVSKVTYYTQFLGTFPYSGQVSSSIIPVVDIG